MEKFGYLLSEAPVLIFVIWFTVRFVQFRRRRNNQPVFSEVDRRTLFGSSRHHPNTLKFYLKLGLAILAVIAVGAIEFIALAPLGAAIITGALILTSAMIVHKLLSLDD
jgi:hypothetical protein